MAFNINGIYNTKESTISLTVCVHVYNVHTAFHFSVKFLLFSCIIKEIISIGMTMNGFLKKIDSVRIKHFPIYIHINMNSIEF